MCTDVTIYSLTWLRNHLCEASGLCSFYRCKNQERRLKEILLGHFWHLICGTPFGGHGILKIEKLLYWKICLGIRRSRSHLFRQTSRNTGIWCHFFPKCESFLGWSDGLPVSPLFLPRGATFPPTFFQLWVIILWTWWWEKSDFPSLHCNLDLGIIHHPPSPNSSHSRVSSSKVSHNRSTYSISGNKNIIYVSA